MEQPVLRVRQYIGLTIFVGGGLVALIAGVVTAF